MSRGCLKSRADRRAACSPRWLRASSRLYDFGVISQKLAVAMRAHNVEIAGAS